MQFCQLRQVIVKFRSDLIQSGSLLCQLSLDIFKLLPVCLASEQGVLVPEVVSDLGRKGNLLFFVVNWVLIEGEVLVEENEDRNYVLLTYLSQMLQADC